MRIRFLLALCIVATLVASGSPTVALVRPLRTIEREILRCNPKLPRALVRSYAKTIREEAEQRHFDPCTEIWLVCRESHFRADVIYHHRGHIYYGLGQIDIYHRKECNPKKGGSLDSPECEKRKAELLDGVYNLRRTAMGITMNRQFCRRLTGRRALFARWLSQYQGYSDSAGRKDVWCNMRKDSKGRWHDVVMPKATRDVIQKQRACARRAQLRRSR